MSFSRSFIVLALSLTMPFHAADIVAYEGSRPTTRALLVRAYGNYAREEYDLAIADLKAILSQKPRDKNAIVLMAECYLGKGDFVNADRQYRYYIKLRPRDDKGYYGVGWVNEKAGNYRSAITAYQLAISKDAKSVVAMNNLAWVLATAPDAALRDGPRAVQLATLAIQLRGRMNFAMADTLAAALAEAGRFEAAVEMQKEAISTASSEKLPQMQHRLKLYEQQQPYRLPAKTNMPTTQGETNAAADCQSSEGS